MAVVNQYLLKRKLKLIMNLNKLIFIENLPHLDIHGLDQIAAKYYINSFITEQLSLKNRFLVIVHGVGSKILLRKTHEVLAKHDKVIAYKVWMFNQGSTVVEIKVD